MQFRAPAFEKDVKDAFQDGNKAGESAGRNVLSEAVVLCVCLVRRKGG